MELYPAIDIRAGRVVRVRRGDPASEILYHPDPGAVLDGYAREGARWVHVVDLDRVFGVGEQTALIAALVRRAPLKVQVGGGVSAAADVEAVLATGAARVIVRATIEAEPGGAGFPDLVRRFGRERLALALDIRAAGGGSVATAAARVHALEPEAALARARRAAGTGIRTVVCTDLGREGRLGGAGVASAATVAREAGVDVIVSGGVQSLEELMRIRDAGLAGAVVGRALFEKRFTLREALACSSS